MQLSKYCVKIDLEKISQFLILFFPLALFLGPAILDTTLTITAVLFIAHTVINQDFDCYRTRWFKLFVLLWTYLVLRSIYSFDAHHSLSASLPFGRFGFFALAVSYWLRANPTLLNKLNLSIFYTVFLVSVSAILQFYFGTDILGNKPEVYPGLIRLKSFAGKLNIGILLTFLYMPYAVNIISKFANYETRKHQLFYWIAISVPALAIFLSGERTAFLLTLLAILILFVTIKPARKIVFKFFVLLGVVICLFSFIKTELAQRQFASTYSQIENFQTTAYGKIYKAAVHIASDNILFGTSPRTFMKVCNDNFEFNDKYRCTNHPHNLYLEIFSESGLVGLTLFIAFLYCVLSLVWKNRKAISKEPFIWGAFLAFVFRFLPFISSGSIYIAWSMGAAWFMLGIVTHVQNAKAR